jgi:hypothetical protein
MNYADVSILDLQDDCFVDLVQNNIEHLRLNQEGTRAIIKWDGNVTPSWLISLGIIIRDARSAKKYYTAENGW